EDESADIRQGSCPNCSQRGSNAQEEGNALDIVFRIIDPDEVRPADRIEDGECVKPQMHDTQADENLNPPASAAIARLCQQQPDQDSDCVSDEVVPFLWQPGDVHWGDGWPGRLIRSATLRLWDVR